MDIRPALPSDAQSLSDMLQTLTAIGKRTLPDSFDFALNSYISHPESIACHVAVEGGVVLGVQVLQGAPVGNSTELARRIGTIGTHIHPDHARRGIGRKLFEQTRCAATHAGLTEITATIGAQNAEGQAYYEAIGFRTFETSEISMQKRLSLI